MRHYSLIIIALITFLSYLHSPGQSRTELITVEEVIDIYYQEALFALREHYAVPTGSDSVMIESEAYSAYSQDKGKLEKVIQEVLTERTRSKLNREQTISFLKRNLKKELPVLPEHYYQRVLLCLSAEFAKRYPKVN